MMNIWQRGTPTTNPYCRTAFRVARVPTDVVRHRTLVQTIAQTRRIVNTDPRAHSIEGVSVSLAELNAAEKVLLDPRSRIVEELLEHATEPEPLGPVRVLAAKVAAALSPGSRELPAVTNLRGLLPWAQALVNQFLEENPGPDPALGDSEPTLLTPFGSPEPSPAGTIGGGQSSAPMTRADRAEPDHERFMGGG